MKHTPRPFQNKEKYMIMAIALGAFVLNPIGLIALLAGYLIGTIHEEDNNSTGGTSAPVA